MVFTMWALSAAWRSVDTRTFARIYAELAVPVIVAQRLDKQSASTVAARVALSREFVDFFEKHLPVLITSLASISGAAIMLFLACFLPGFTRTNEALYTRLNNRLEREVTFASAAPSSSLTRRSYWRNIRS